MAASSTIRNLSLSNFAKSDTNPHVFKSKFPEISDAYKTFIRFEDGSKMYNGTAVHTSIRGNECAESSSELNSLNFEVPSL